MSGPSSRRFSRSSRNRLNRFSLEFFTGDNLYSAIGRAVCRAEALPRKEFFESWEVAKEIRKRVRGRPVVEFAAGHGLLGAMMLIVDDSIPHVTCIDRRKPLSHDRLMESLVEEWPRIDGRVKFLEQRIEESEMPEPSLAVSVHGCGVLTDRVLDRALASRSAVAVLPCCHDFSRSEDAGLSGWMEPRLAIDAARATRLGSHGYQVITTTIPEDITPHNRLLLGWPEDPALAR